MGKINTRKLVYQCFMVIVGLTIYVAGVAFFILPLDMIAAGTTGIALVMQKMFGIPLSVFVAVFNVVMFTIGWIELGKEFALSTLVATVYLPFALENAIRLVGDTVLTTDPMLSAVCAGVLMGVALGIVFRTGASTGGTDIPPLVLKKRFNIPVAVTLYIIDFVVLVAQMFFGEPERALYGILMVFVYTMVIDKVLLMGSKQVQVQIISTRYEEINEMVQTRLDRGTTLLSIEGGHTRKKSLAVMVMISGRELNRLKQMVGELDPNAFMIINQVGEVRGHGFTLAKTYE